MFGKKKTDTTNQKKRKRTFLGGGGSYPQNNFDAQYRKMLNVQERVERIEVVASKLKDRYRQYADTASFVEYLRATDEIFARAESEHWTIEKTEHEMIQGEMYLMSLQSGIDEDVFHNIYEEFRAMNTTARRIQVVAKRLIEKYAVEYDGAARKFITYIKDYLLIFSQALEGEISLDETKEQVIRARMRVLGEHRTPPEHVLERIYKEFFLLLEDSSIDLSQV